MASELGSVKAGVLANICRTDEWGAGPQRMGKKAECQESMLTQGKHAWTLKKKKKGTEKEGKIILFEFRTQKAGKLSSEGVQATVWGGTLGI